jgi:hypothetical protein
MREEFFILPQQLVPPDFKVPKHLPEYCKKSHTLIYWYGTEVCSYTAMKYSRLLQILLQISGVSGVCLPEALE